MLGPLERGKVGKRQLVAKGQRHARVLQHVVERQVLDLVVGRVDVVVRVLKGRLDDEGRGIAGLGRRGVVGAGVAALGLDVGEVAVLGKGSATTTNRWVRVRHTSVMTVLMNWVRFGST